MNSFTEFCIFFQNFKTSFHSRSITLVMLYFIIQLCDVAEVAMVHKYIEPNLVIFKTGK
jgi:hypothetical protein